MIWVVVSVGALALALIVAVGMALYYADRAGHAEGRAIRAERERDALRAATAQTPAQKAAAFDAAARGPQT